MKKLLPLAALLLFFVPAAAMADDIADMNHMNMDAASPADKAFAQSMQKMMQDMNGKPTGDADKDFVMMMMPHHQGAVDMAKIELQYGKDPMLRRMAQAIVTSQEKEIAEMKEWQAKHTK